MSGILTRQVTITVVSGSSGDGFLSPNIVSCLLTERESQGSSDLLDLRLYRAVPVGGYCIVISLFIGNCLYSIHQCVRSHKADAYLPSVAVLGV